MTTSMDMKAKRELLQHQLNQLDRDSMKTLDFQLRPLPILVAAPSKEKEHSSPTDEDLLVSPRADTDKGFDLHGMDHLRTVLQPPPAIPFCTYVRVPWTLDVRKEVFSPSERLAHPTLVQLVFAQIVHDVFRGDCVRFGSDDRRNIHVILDSHGLHRRNVGAGHTVEVKHLVIDAAKRAPYYFSRMFSVNGGSRYRNLHLIGVSHSGVRLITRCKDTYEDYFKLIEHVKFEELLEVSTPQPSTVLLCLLDKKNIVVYSHMAQHICNFINSYKLSSEKTLQPIKSGIGH